MRAWVVKYWGEGRAWVVRHWWKIRLTLTAGGWTWRGVSYLLAVVPAAGGGMVVGVEIQRIETERVRVEYRERLREMERRAETAEAKLLDSEMKLGEASAQLSELERKVSSGDRDLQKLQAASLKAKAEYARALTQTPHADRARLCRELAGLGFPCR